MKKEENNQAVEEKKPKTAPTHAAGTKAKKAASTKKKSSAPKKQTPPSDADELTVEDVNLEEDPNKELTADLPDHAPTEEEETEQLLDGMNEETAEKPAPAKQSANSENKNNKQDDGADNNKKGLFSFLKKKKNKEQVDPLAGVERFKVDGEKGLSQEQIDTRVSQGLVNSTPKKYSKTYKSIFFGNIFSVFNLLCIACAAALALAHAPYTQYFFVLIFLCNITISIIQEIRAKRMIDKLSILSSSTAKAVRGGAKIDIPVEEIVIDDVLILSAGQQVPADCTVISGNAEFNEALLTGESVAIKKNKGDELYAGSFVASGQVVARVEKIGDFTYISKLTAKAKKYKRPNSEIMNSINLFIKIIGIAIIPIAILMFFNNFAASKFGKWENLPAEGFWATLFSENSEGVLSQVLQKTVAVVIGMIPSGLLLLTTVALSVGIIRLTKYKTLVQDMYSLEMLARVNVLCLDKTGTITDGRMHVNGCEVIENKSKHDVKAIVARCWRRSTTITKPRLRCLIISVARRKCTRLPTCLSLPRESIRR